MLKLIKVLGFFFLYLFKYFIPKRNTVSLSDIFYKKGFFNNSEEYAVELLSTSNDNELLIVQIILDSRSIPYVVFNNSLSNLYPGPYIWGYNAARIYVKENDLKNASQIITEHYKRQGETVSIERSSSKFRNMIEVLLLGWIVHDKGYKGNVFIKENEKLSLK